MSERLVVIVFQGYYLLALAATVFHRNRLVRGIYLTGFLALASASGFTGTMAWPFFSWHLYAYEAPAHFVFLQIRVADRAGREIRYDARATPPSLTTPLRRFASQFATYSREDAQEFARFLLDQASAYRARLGQPDPTVWSRLRFPRHQLGFRWSSETISDFGDFEEVRLYRVEVALSHDGRTLLSKHERLLARYP